MSDQLKPDEAALALTEIRQRQEQVIRLALIPTWYWWALGGLMVGFSAAVDTQTPLAIGIGTTLFVLGVVGTTGWVVVGAVRHAQVRNELMGATGILAILGFVALVLAVTFPIAFTLQAAGVPFAATLGMLPAAAILIAGGPVLMRYLQRLMLSRSAGAPR